MLPGPRPASVFGTTQRAEPHAASRSAAGSRCAARCSSAAASICRTRSRLSQSSRPSEGELQGDGRRGCELAVRVRELVGLAPAVVADLDVVLVEPAVQLLELVVVEVELGRGRVDFGDRHAALPAPALEQRHGLVGSETVIGKSYDR